MYLTDLILKIKKGQVAMVTFKQDRWYVINSNGIRCCDINGENIGETINLTTNNILAHYVLIDDISWIKEKSI